MTIETTEKIIFTEEEKQTIAHFRTIISSIFHNTHHGDIECIADTIIDELANLEQFSNY